MKRYFLLPFQGGSLALVVTFTLGLILARRAGPTHHTGRALEVVEERLASNARYLPKQSTHASTTITP